MSADETGFDEFSFLAEDAARLGVVAPLPTVRRVHVTADGEDVSALVWGDAAPEFAFVHGAGQNAHSWDSAMLVLGRPAVVIELPGHGDSAWRSDFDYAPESIAPTVADAVEQLAGRGTVLVGHSLGGLTASIVAGTRPGLARALVVVDITPGRSVRRSAAGSFMAGPESFPSREAVVERAVEFGLGPTAESLRRGVYLNTRVRPDGRVIFKHHFGNRPPDAPPAYTDVTPIWADLERSGVPTLLVAGTHGVLTEENLTEFTDRVPRSTVVRLEAGHNVQRDRPVELVEAIRAFTARTDGEPAADD